MVMEGVLDDMKKRGVKHVHAYSVDNILVKVADPYFIGFCASREGETGLKVVPKISADEVRVCVCVCLRVCARVCAWGCRWGVSCWARSPAPPHTQWLLPFH